MTPIFFHEDQRVDYDFISVNKIPRFVDAAARTPHTFKPIVRENLYRVHMPSYVDGVLDGKVANGFSTKDPQITRSLLASNGSMLAAAQHAMAFDGVACSASQGFHHAGTLRPAAADAGRQRHHRHLPAADCVQTGLGIPGQAGGLPG